MDTIEQRLGSLHDLLCDHLTDVLRNGEEEVTQEGEVVRTKPKAATLSVIRQFLKDNKVEGLNAKGKPIHNLVDALPDFGEDDDTVVPLMRA